MVLNSTEDGKVTRNVEVLQNEKDIGTFDIEKNGIISFVSKTRDGKDEKFVITGFDDFSKKEEAEDAIKAVIADNSYAPEFVIVKKQVVATLASAYILHLDEIKHNLAKGNDKKLQQEFERLKPYNKSEELNEYFSYEKNQKNLQETKESLNAVIAQNALGFQSFKEIKEQYPNAVDLSNSDKKKWSYKEVSDYLKSIVNDVMVTSDGNKIAISDDYRHIEESSDSATRKGTSNDTFTEVSKEKSVKVGNSFISHSDKSEPGSPLSALTDTLNISQTHEKSSNEKEIVSKSKFNNLAKEYNGLLKDFDNNIKDFNNLLSAYNKSQEENQKLKNQLQSQNQKKNQNISR